METEPLSCCILDLMFLVNDFTECTLSLTDTIRRVQVPLSLVTSIVGLRHASHCSPHRIAILGSWLAV
jgi:hypothetical protein